MSPTNLFIVFITLFAVQTFVNGDLYMQNPRGNNDRYNEEGDRQNANRLFDSQNNARGGYCWGPEMKYYEGSKLSIEWTNQHGCGNDDSKCNIVLQYMCADDSAAADQTLVIRDGTTTTTIPTGTTPGNTNYYNYQDPKVGDGTVFTYGMNEPISFYQACANRDRNKGLFTADQNVRTDKGAMATRQNPNGDRYGFECSEERDYYPYWHPSPWKDIGVLVEDKDDCDFYQSNSQNVASKNYCDGTTAQQKNNNERTCTESGGSWKSAPAFGIPSPGCSKAPLNRNNHLGNGVGAFANQYNWTLPRSNDEACIDQGSCACVLRMRYNISVGDYNPNGVDSTNSGANSPVQEDQTVSVMGYNLTLAYDTAQTGRTFQDRSFMFRIIPRPEGVSKSADIYNLNVRGKRGNIVQTYPATEYDFVPTNLEVDKGDFVHFQWTGCDTNPGGNAGEGTAKTDRSNIVQIADLTRNYPMKDSEITSSNALFKDDAVRLSMASLDQVNCKSYDQLKADNGNNQGNIDADKQNCMKLNAAGPYYKGHLVKMEDEGTYYYMSTRNNNFSNRVQKASIKVKPTWHAWQTALIVVGGVVGVSVGAAAGCVAYAFKNPHSRIADFVRKVPGLKNRI